jgi:hypothetical protein
MRWRIVPASRFGEYAARWDELHARQSGSPMLAPAFVSTLLACFGTGTELLALCEAQDQVCAAAVLAPQGPGRWATFQPAQAPVGLWLQAPGLALEPLLDNLLSTLPGFPLLLGLTQCDPFLMTRSAAAGRIGALDYIDTARISLRTSFDDYWQARGKNLRNNLKKQRNRLAAEGIATRLEVLTAPEDMAVAVADYGVLESKGWKAQNGSAVGTDNEQGHFYRRMMEAFAQQGQARAYRYWFDERLVAMDLCIVDRDCIVILKTSYDESVPAGFSPALLMREEATRALFGEAPLARIEFYGKVMEWHTRWTDEVRTLYHLNHYRWPVLARAHALLRARAKAATNDGV